MKYGGSSDPKKGILLHPDGRFYTQQEQVAAMNGNAKYLPEYDAIWPQPDAPKASLYHFMRWLSAATA